MTRVLPPIVGAESAVLRAIVVERRPLTPWHGPGLPPHVRAGSALAAWGDELLVVQDDTLAVARVPRGGGALGHLLLPLGPDGARTFDAARGNKKLKLDLEAAFVDAGRLYALGSGSLGARERVVAVAPATGEVEVRQAPDLYAGLRATLAFAGSDLNLEGAALRGDELLLAQRGNGAPAGDLLPIDAIGALDLQAWRAWWRGGPTPRLTWTRELRLGALDGVRLTATDLAARPDGRLVVLAAAEDSPDAVDDGPVAGVALGVVDGDRCAWARLRDADGAPVLDKAEGLVLDGDGAWLVTDPDAPDTPALLLRVVFEGA